MRQYQFSETSLRRLHGVHPILVTIVTLALRKYTDEDFTVLEGERSRRRQRELVNKGKSQTMDSKHLLQDDGYAHAVDLGPLTGGEIPWDDWSAFERLADAMQEAADEIGYGDRLTWGGDWDSLRDGPHYEINL